MLDHQLDVLGLIGILDNKLVEIGNPDCDIYAVIDTLVFDVAYSPTTQKCFKINIDNYYANNGKPSISEEIEPTHAMKDVVDLYLNGCDIVEYSHNNMNIKTRLTRKAAKEIQKEIDADILKHISALAKYTANRLHDRC